MKIKSLLIGMLACTALVGCTNDDEPVVNNGKENSEKAYLAVTLVNPSVNSRATGDYNFGTEAEQTVTSARFYLFDAQGNAYTISDESNSGKNYVDASAADLGGTFTDTGNSNVETILNAVLVINKSKIAPPASILAVLNADETILDDTSLSLSALQGKAFNFGTIKGSSADEKPYTTKGKFVMSNSVYVDASGTVAVATPIAAENIKTNADDAKAAPVKIYVERAAAKVQTQIAANAPTAVDKTGKIFKLNNGYYAWTGEQNGNGDPVYAHLKGWRVTNITEKTNLIKSLNNAWLTTAPFASWYNASDYRSYWAVTAGTPAWLWNFDDATLPFTDNNYEYYNENTNNGAATATHFDQKNSQLLVAADFVTIDENNTVSAAGPIAEWYGVKYTLEGLKQAVATSLASKLYTDAAGTVSITKDAISFEQVAETTASGRYISKIKVATGTYYYKDATGVKAYNATGNTTLASVVDALQPVKIWGDIVKKDGVDTYVGGGYYYIDIVHNGAVTKDASGNVTSDTRVYGLVRNHWYQLTLTNLKGLGTPVYNPALPITTEKPSTDHSYIAAQINVLAWRMVNQDVTLE